MGVDPNLNTRFQIARVIRDEDGKHRILAVEWHLSFRGAIVVARRMRRKNRVADDSMYLIVDRMLFPAKPPVYRLRDDGFTEGYRIPAEMRANYVEAPQP
jgi:hypothetical protein